MKGVFIFILGIIFTSCTDHQKVMNEYKKGNPHAKELLLHGFHQRNSEYISSTLIDRALRGDEEAQNIIYAQIETMHGMPQSRYMYSHPIVVPVN